MKYIGEKVEGEVYKERRASYGLIFNEEGKLAVTYVKKYDMYNMLGGKIEKEEDSKEALIRETEEEIGYTLKDIEYVDSLGCYYYFDILGEYQLGIMDVYSAKIDKQIRNSLEEGIDLVWVDPKEIADKMYFEYHRYIINNFVKL